MSMLAQEMILRLHNDDGDPGTYTAITKFESVPSYGFETDEQEITTLDSVGGFKEYLSGLKNGESSEITIVWDPNLADHQALKTAADAGDTRKFQTVFPADSGGNKARATAEFIIKGFKPSAETGTAIKATIPLKMSGSVVWDTEV